MFLPDDTPLGEVEMPNTTYEILIACGYRSIGDVRRANDADLRAVPGIGKERLAQIRAVIPEGAALISKEARSR